MRYVFPAIAEIYCETTDNRLLFSNLSWWFDRNVLLFSSLNKNKEAIYKIAAFPFNLEKHILIHTILYIKNILYE